MYINLVLGGVALVLIGVLILRWRRDRLTPADLLQEELGKRRDFKQEAGLFAAEYTRRKQEKLEQLEVALADMREALPAEDKTKDVLTWVRHEDGITLQVVDKRNSALGLDSFELGWHIRSFDVSRPVREQESGPRGGEYRIKGAGFDTCSRDLSEFLRNLSAIIADRIA